MISVEDVLKVADNLNLFLSYDNIREVIDMYPDEQENDPTATWNLVVENCIYNVLNN